VYGQIAIEGGDREKGCTKLYSMARVAGRADAKEEHREDVVKQ